jgi:hypothetical protein
MRVSRVYPLVRFSVNKVFDFPEDVIFHIGGFFYKFTIPINNPQEKKIINKKNIRNK